MYVLLDANSNLIRLRRLRNRATGLPITSGVTVTFTLLDLDAVEVYQTALTYVAARAEWQAIMPSDEVDALDLDADYTGRVEVDGGVNLMLLADCQVRVQSRRFQ